LNESQMLLLVEGVRTATGSRQSLNIGVLENMKEERAVTFV